RACWACRRSVLSVSPALRRFFFSESLACWSPTDFFTPANRESSITARACLISVSPMDPDASFCFTKAAISAASPPPPTEMVSAGGSFVLSASLSSSGSHREAKPKELAPSNVLSSSKSFSSKLFILRPMSFCFCLSRLPLRRARLIALLFLLLPVQVTQISNTTLCTSRFISSSLIMANLFCSALRACILVLCSAVCRVTCFFHSRKTVLISLREASSSWVLSNFFIACLASRFVRAERTFELAIGIEDGEA
ncbi:unnamed protein product, partial [Heterosigma akashiwo]